MIREYAVDPRLLNSWERVRYYCEQFGWGRGRLISRFPKAWKKMVWQAAQSAHPRERKRIEEFMARMDVRLMEQSRPYDGELPWHQNAIRAHEEKDFQAIITDEPISCGNIGISNEDFSDDHPLLVTSKHVEIPRAPREFADFLSPALVKARRVLLVDPYFDPYPYNTRPTKWTLPLAAILLRVPSTCCVEYHTLRATSRGTRIPTGQDEIRDVDGWRRSCMEDLPHVLPKDAKLTIHRWQERPDGEDFHARYIITDRCALQVDPGLDASRSTATDRTKFTYLGESDRVRLLAKFNEGAGVYTHLGKLDVTGIGDWMGGKLIQELG